MGQSVRLSTLGRRLSAAHGPRPASTPCEAPHVHPPPPTGAPTSPPRSLPPRRGRGAVTHWLRRLWRVSPRTEQAQERFPEPPWPPQSPAPLGLVRRLSGLGSLAAPFAFPSFSAFSPLSSPGRAAGTSGPHSRPTSGARGAASAPRPRALSAELLAAAIMVSWEGLRGSWNSVFFLGGEGEARRGTGSGVTWTSCPRRLPGCTRGRGLGVGGRGAMEVGEGRATWHLGAGEEEHEACGGVEGCGRRGPRARPAAFMPSPPPALARTSPWGIGPVRSWGAGCLTRPLPTLTLCRGVRASEMASACRHRTPPGAHFLRDPLRDFESWSFLREWLLPGPCEALGGWVPGRGEGGRGQWPPIEAPWRERPVS